MRRATIKKLLSIGISAAMAVTVLPSAAFAAEGLDEEPDISPTEEIEVITEPAYEDLSEVPVQEEEQLENAQDTEAAEQVEPSEQIESAAEEPAPLEVASVQTGWKAPAGNIGADLALCCRADGVAFDLIKHTGQKLFGYDTLQGACANKGYAYFTLYNRTKNRTKIAKVRLSDMSVTKVSGALNIQHANEITFNTKKNIIVVADSTPVPKRVSVISPSTLKVKYHKTLKVTKSVKNMSKKQRKKFKGIGAIAYNAKHNCYIAYMTKSHDLLFLNSNLKPYKRVKQNARLGLVYQGMDSYKDCIMICQSFKGSKKYNAVTFYNMKGKKIARLKIPAGSPMKEIETLFHDGDRFYTGFYTSFATLDSSKKREVHRLNFVYEMINL